MISPRLATYSIDGSTRYGAVTDSGIVDLSAHCAKDYPTLREVIAQLADDAELITCLRGVGAPLDDQAVRGLLDGDPELELSDGGQESYWWLLSAE